MRLPVETSLAKLLPAHNRPTQSTEILAKQLSLMRQEAQTSTQDSKERNAETANKTKSTPELQISQKVYKVKDVLGDAEDHKTAPNSRDHTLLSTMCHIMYTNCSTSTPGKFCKVMYAEINCWFWTTSASGTPPFSAAIFSKEYITRTTISK